MSTLSFLNVERTPTVETRLRELSERLRRYHDRIRHCQMTVSRPADNGLRVAVRIHVSIPGAQIHAEGERRADVNEEALLHDAVLSAAADAFESARRQLGELQRDGGRYSFLEQLKRLNGERG